MIFWDFGSKTDPACEVLAGLAFFHPVIHLTTKDKTALPRRKVKGQREVTELGCQIYLAPSEKGRCTRANFKVSHSAKTRKRKKE